MKNISEAKRAKLLAARPDTPIRIWTAQDAPAVEAAQRRGYLTDDPDWTAPEFIRAYDWMKQKMAERL